MYFILTLEEGPTEEHNADIWKQANRSCKSCRYESQGSSYFSMIAYKQIQCFRPQLNMLNTF